MEKLNCQLIETKDLNIPMPEEFDSNDVNCLLCDGYVRISKKEYLNKLKEKINEIYDETKQRQRKFQMRRLFNSTYPIKVYDGVISLDLNINQKKYNFSQSKILVPGEEYLDIVPLSNIHSYLMEQEYKIAGQKDSCLILKK